MKITVFTSNQPRHISLIESLATIADEVFAIQEVNTVFPGEVEDFYKKTPIMQEYFQKVLAAEKKVFGVPRFSSSKVRTISIKVGDLNRLSQESLEDALHSDYYVIFGSSFIRGWICEFLEKQTALNIHMGISPYYRGNSCNFWALYDNRPDLVGATIHLLTAGLDSGPMLYHAIPGSGLIEPFELGMLAVKAAHESLVENLKNGKIHSYQHVKQDKSLELRYTRNQDFTDQVAAEFLNRKAEPKKIKNALNKRDLGMFVAPFIK